MLTRMAESTATMSSLYTRPVLETISPTTSTVTGWSLLKMRLLRLRAGLIEGEQSVTTSGFLAKFSLAVTIYPDGDQPEANEGLDGF